MEIIFTCNRCNQKFFHTTEWEPDFYKGVARVPMSFHIVCPFCGRWDSHYVFETDQKGKE